MIHGLAALFSGVYYNAIAIAQSLFAGNIGSGQKQVAQQIPLALVCFTKRADMFPGHNQDMHRRLGVEIRKGVTEIVLVDSGGRNFAFDDFAEGAAHSVISVHGAFPPENGALLKSPRFTRAGFTSGRAFPQWNA